MQPLEGFLRILTVDWSREEQEVCGDRKLPEGIMQAIIEERN